MISAHREVNGFDESEVGYRLPEFRWQMRHGLLRKRLFLKLPMTTAYMTDYVERFRKTRFLWMIRNPVAVLSSMARFAPNGQGSWLEESSADELRRMSGLLSEITELKLCELSDPIARGAWVWVCKVHAMQEFAAAGFRIHPLRYEALLEYPERELRAVCDFLSIPFDPAMLTYNRQHKGKTYAGGSTGDRPLDPSRAKPKSALSDADQATIREICGPLMSEWGYDQPRAALAGK